MSKATSPTSTRAITTFCLLSKIKAWSANSGCGKRSKHIRRRSTIRTRLTLIVHNINEVNRAISTGQYFFTDIKKEGVLLYNSDRFVLAEERGSLTPEERQQTAQDDFKYWFKSANGFVLILDMDLRTCYNKAAFELHQATERLYVTFLLVFTHYKAKEHDIKLLGKQVNNLDPRFLPVFPRTTPEEDDCLNCSEGIHRCPL